MISMSYDLAKLPISTLMEPAFRAGAELVRLDERIARSPVGQGFLERSRFTDACSSLWIDGELVHLEDLVRAAFDDVVGTAVRRVGFEERLDKVAFVGVSQGAIVALDAVASGRWPVGVLVTFAGLLPPMTISPKATTTSVLLIHGAADTTIPPAETSRASQRLAAAGVDVESHILPGVGHTLSMDGVELALHFLTRAFAEPYGHEDL